MRITACTLALFLLTMVHGFRPADAVATESAGTLTAQALAECQKGRRAQAREIRLAHFEHGLALAERAVALDGTIADAHFAVFCNLGETLRVDGESLTSLFGFGKLMSALDRALELDPDHLDALSCKGTLLVKLPGILGGDRDRGERLLERVIQEVPDESVNARLVLAESYAGRGERQQALMLARTALAIARALGREDLIPEAEQTLGRLDPDATPTPASRPLLARP